MISEIENIIKSKNGVLLYFSGGSCSVCHALRPKIESAFEENFPEIERIFISAEENKELAAHFSIFTVPSLLVFLGGKEFVREARHISVDDVLAKVERPYSIMTS